MNFTKRELTEENSPVFITHYIARAEGYKIIFSNSKAGTVEFDYETMTKAEAYDLIHVEVEPYYKLSMPDGEIIGYPFHSLEAVKQFCLDHYINTVLDEQGLLELHSKIATCRENIRIIREMERVNSHGSSRIKLETVEAELDEALIILARQKEIC